jgi:3-hydroxybutyryl-CoA dehydrogenase
MNAPGTRSIGVLGVGTMGAGIVQLAAQTGHAVVACDLSIAALEKALLYVHDGLSRFVDRGAFSQEEAEEHYDCVHWTVNLEDMARVDAAIEAIAEKVASKKRRSRR